MLGLGLIVAGMAMNLRAKGGAKKLEVIRAEPTKTMEIKNVMVDLSGEVMKPGVYKLGGEARINDVLVAAGGLTAMADREWVEANINRVEKVRDGMKIFIPNKTSEVVLGVKAPVIKASGVVSLNNAILAELETLPGIGPAMGQRIIDYRLKNGGFKSVEEVKLVEGIGDKLFEKIKNQIGL